MQTRTAVTIARSCLAGVLLTALAPVSTRALERPRRIAPGQQTALRNAAGPTGSIAVQVRAADSGALLAGVWVRLLDAAGVPLLDAAGDSGEYSIGLPVGTYYARTTNELGFIDELYDDIPCPGGSCSLALGKPIVVTPYATTSISFVLMPGGRVSGRVTAEGSGDPVAGADVILDDVTGNPVAYGLTDSTGAYETSGVPTGTYYARSRNPAGYIDERYDNVPCPDGSCPAASGTAIPVTAGATSGGIDFALAPGGRIGGRVTAEGSGAPVPSAYVAVLDAGGTRVAEEYADSNGVYLTTGIPSGTYTVKTSNDQGFIGELYDNVPCPGMACDSALGQPVVVAAGATTAAIDFALAAGGRIAGLVTVERSGKPVPRARVFVYDSVGGNVAEGQSDALGAYLTTALPSGTYTVRTTNDRDYMDELYDNIPCPNGSCTVTTGAPVAVTVGTTTAGVDFALSGGPPVDLGFFTVAPCRVFDTRLQLPLSPGVDLPVEVAGQCGVPAAARAAAVNITVTGATREGYVVVYPAGTQRPEVSTVNFGVAQTRASNAAVGLGTHGSVAVVFGQVYGSNAMVDVIIDVAGYFQ
jgi:hypothetical protein